MAEEVDVSEDKRLGHTTTVNEKALLHAFLKDFQA
jgi:hypothetical protein